MVRGELEAGVEADELEHPRHLGGHRDEPQLTTGLLELPVRDDESRETRRVDEADVGEVDEKDGRPLAQDQVERLVQLRGSHDIDLAVHEQGWLPVHLGPHDVECFEIAHWTAFPSDDMTPRSRSRPRARRTILGPRYERGEPSRSGAAAGHAGDPEAARGASGGVGRSLSSGAKDGGSIAVLAVAHCLTAAVAALHGWRLHADPLLAAPRGGFSKHDWAGVVAVVVGLAVVVLGWMRIMARVAGAILLPLAGLAILIVGVLLFTRTL